MAEIIDGFFSLALLADGYIHPQPVQRVFIVEIDTAPPGMPGLWRKIKLRSGAGCVLQVSPRAPRSVIERGRGDRQGVTLLLGSVPAAAGGQHGAEIIRKTFIHPE